jgi:glycosyltransferase involved in cell wall biosynthesis
MTYQSTTEIDGQLTILVVTDAFWPQHTGGITKSLATEVEKLVDNGHEVVVVTRRLQEDSPQHDPREGYDVYRCRSPTKDSRLYHAYPLASLGLLPRLVDRLNDRFGFDIAYVHNAFQSKGVDRASSSIPQIYTYHAPLSGEIAIHADKGKYGWKTPIVRVANHGFKRLERHVLDTADLILARSQFMADEISRIHGDGYNPEIIPLAVDSERFAFTESPRGARNELGLPTDRTILLTVRRLVPRVGLESLIDAMVAVAEHHPDVLLLIGGKGYLRSTLEQRIRERNLEDHVQLLGFIPENDLPKYYGAADISVMPTEELEGFGLSTIESLSCGTPVVATPVGANPGVLGPLNEKLLCEDASARALAERLTEWIKRGIQPELRINSRQYCEKAFSARAVVESLETLFENTI